MSRRPFLGDISAETLRELIDYNPSTGKFYSGTGRMFGKELGHPHPRGYIKLTVLGKDYLAHRLAWLYVHGEWPPEVIDHINRIKTDNRIENLQAVTHAENLRLGHARRRAEMAVAA